MVWCPGRLPAHLPACLSVCLFASAACLHCLSPALLSCTVLYCVPPAFPSCTACCPCCCPALRAVRIAVLHCPALRVACIAVLHCPAAVRCRAAFLLDPCCPVLPIPSSPSALPSPLPHLLPSPPWTDHPAITLPSPVPSRHSLAWSHLCDWPWSHRFWLTWPRSAASTGWSWA